MFVLHTAVYDSSVVIKDLIIEAKDLTAEAKTKTKDFKAKAKVFEAKARAPSPPGQRLVFEDTSECMYTVSRKKRGSTFDIITLEKHTRFL